MPKCTGIYIKNDFLEGYRASGKLTKIYILNRKKRKCLDNVMLLELHLSRGFEAAHTARRERERAVWLFFATVGISIMELGTLEADGRVLIFHWAKCNFGREVVF